MVISGVNNGDCAKVLQNYCTSIAKVLHDVDCRQD